jgi:beta-galactosidase
VGSTIRLAGDSAQASPIEVFAPKQVRVIFWNDKELKSSRTSYGSLQASLPQPPSIKLPSLGPWKYNDSLPEKAQDYQDNSAAWICKLSQY